MYTFMYIVYLECLMLVCFQVSNILYQVLSVFHLEYNLIVYFDIYVEY